jgi:23S rRNA (cytosine1962-C5)-methyltransferase
MNTVTIKRKKEIALQRRHPWVFSGAIKSGTDGLQEGETVNILGESGKDLGVGHYQSGSIMLRVISFEPTDAGQAFWTQKIQQAYDCRARLGLTERPDLQAFRLIHAEGDGLPGLIIDLYGGTAVIQCHSVGMHRSIDYIVSALQEVLGPKLEAIYQKSKNTLPNNYAQQVTDGYLFGEASPTVVEEYGHKFMVDWEGGQKTGFFLDQRENRRLLAEYAPGKKVLNTFCYTGGFSIYALQAGAQAVTSVDVSASAMELTDKNVALGGFGPQLHNSHTQDVMQFFKESEEEFDIIIVDPPAFAKNIRKRHNAVQGYKRLNALALKRVKPGGLLFTFSCSQVVDQKLFYDTIVAAAMEAGRQARVVHQLTQGPDHPVNIFHPEGAYLKGLVLMVD